MKKYIIIAIIILSGIHTYAQTTGRNAVERMSNRKQIAEGQKMLERDIPELTQFQNDYEAFRIALMKRDLNKIESLRASMHEAMKRELEQSKGKAEAARRELAGARSEVRSDRREVRNDKQQVPTRDNQDDLRRDQYNQVDDRMDAMDDNIDFQKIVKRAEMQGQIYKAVLSSKVAFETDEDIKAVLKLEDQYQKFLHLMQADVQQTKEEIAEDRGEAGEDRRETRDDIRETNERNNSPYHRGRR